MQHIRPENHQNYISMNNSFQQKKVFTFKKNIFLIIQLVFLLIYSENFYSLTYEA
jgi:hypothetical protein